MHLSFHSLVLISILAFACTVTVGFREWQLYNLKLMIFCSLHTQSTKRNNHAMIWKTVHETDVGLKDRPFVNTQRKVINEIITMVDDPIF